ncbi:site-specific DNA-methyltransferase [Panacibacter ginsenosidivorans]|uniref:Methyltransferase n=1 Tax=Panacibacter ginsenosidivorans TaxID=1813871 RepID=A0A5B8V8V0_9BACT|nr:site-specific DNA-methyltransferase [Panacibacter ginsenosidivorans]QEC67927.1 site-specific DNA-methyltransferase [Panacibacter ginsenosidivorans]
MSIRVAYKTDYGISYEGKIEDFISSKKTKHLKGTANLIFTSPPFPLNRKKKYGNLNGQEYIDWITKICKDLVEFLAKDGSLVIEVGNSWESGHPVMSTLSIEALLSILKEAKLYLCQQFVWYNTAKLPSPAQWVNIDRVRVKDSFTHIWWMSKTPRPKANNRKVLKEYSSSMKKLIETGKYNAGKRPSEHDISANGFSMNNNGAIPSNVLVSANTQSSSKYLEYCKQNDYELHPARMPIDIPNFFIKMLTEENDLVIDPFGGSNTTGESSEALKRRWISVEANKKYVLGSKGRFL